MSRRCRTGSSRERGVALVVVLWVAVLVSALAAAFVLDTRIDTRLAWNHVENAKARALADGAVEIAIHELLSPEPRFAWRPDGTPARLELPEGDVEIAIRDEAGKIDLNRAPEELLRGLLAAVGIAPERIEPLVEAIVEWRDERPRRSGSQRRLRGAAAVDYRAAGFANGSAGRPFLAVDELQQVRGVERTLYERLRRFITVYSERADLDPMTAPPLVLLALPGATPELVAEALQLRDADEDGAARTLLQSSMPAEYLGIGGGVTFTIQAWAMVPSGARFTREAVVEFSSAGSPPFRVREWRQGDWYSSAAELDRGG